MCIAAAYNASAVIGMPGAEVSQVKGSLLHRDFGAGAFAEVFVLTFVLCFIVTLRPVRPYLRAAGFAAGFGLFAGAVLVVEARVQSHDLLTERAIRNRFGSEATVYLVAAGAGVLGLVISTISIRKRR